MIDITAFQRPKALRASPPPISFGVASVEGRAQFYIGVNISADELSEWSPHRIEQFFNGIARIITARGGVGFRQ